jgi:anti-sigma regulatory factor (Ser/Thr protein kinase)
MCDTTADARVTLPKSLRAPALARDFVEQNTCMAHGSRAAVALQLLASELVTNAVLYGEAPIWMEISCSVYSTQIRVHDENRDEPAFRSDDGLGLLLVDKVAHEWGTDVTETGKTVWGTVPTGFMPQQAARPWQGTQDRSRRNVPVAEGESSVGTPSY